MSERRAIFWLNGSLREERIAIDIGDRGFLIGDGLFETILVKNGVPAFVEAHRDRLIAGAAALSMPLDLSLDVLDGAITALVQRNKAGQETAICRVTVSRGAGGRGLDIDLSAPVTVLITLTPVAASLSHAPLRLSLSDYRRSEHSIASRFKLANYADAIVARAQARENGFDEAILLNSAGRIACAAAANIFLVDAQGDVLTPPVGEGALPGVVRRALLEGCGAPLRIAEAPIAPPFQQYCGVFVTNSLLGVARASWDQLRPDATGVAAERIDAVSRQYNDILQDYLSRKGAIAR